MGESFYDCVMNIPAEAEIKAVALEDFVPRKGLWDNRDGRVTLMGDAAHAMTMCTPSCQSSFGQENETMLRYT